MRRVNPGSDTTSIAGSGLGGADNAERWERVSVTLPA